MFFWSLNLHYCIAAVVFYALYVYIYMRVYFSPSLYMCMCFRYIFARDCQRFLPFCFGGIFVCVLHRGIGSLDRIATPYISYTFLSRLYLPRISAKAHLIIETSEKNIVHALILHPSSPSSWPEQSLQGFSHQSAQHCKQMFQTCLLRFKSSVAWADIRQTICAILKWNATGRKRCLECLRAG